MSMIWKRLDVQGGELTLALALGDFANDHGESIWPSVATLCFKTRQGERTVRRQLARFRELKWLEIVKQGGGAGQTTLYRINPEWIKGANLAGFPDLKCREFADEKGADLAGIKEKPCHPGHETLPSATENPATAVAPNPSGSTNKPLSAATRAIPSGSRAAKTPEETEKADLAAKQLRASWGSMVMTSMLGLAPFYDAARLDTGKVRPTGWDDLTSEARVTLPAVVSRLVDRALAWATDIPPKPDSVITAMVNDELVTELKQFRKPTRAERAA